MVVRFLSYTFASNSSLISAQKYSYHVILRMESWYYELVVVKYQANFEIHSKLSIRALIIRRRHSGKQAGQYKNCSTQDYSKRLWQTNRKTACTVLFDQTLRTPNPVPSKNEELGTHLHVIAPIWRYGIFGELYQPRGKVIELMASLQAPPDANGILWKRLLSPCFCHLLHVHSVISSFRPKKWYFLPPMRTEN